MAVDYQHRRESERFERTAEAYFTFSTAHSIASRQLDAVEECGERYAAEPNPPLTLCDAERRDWADAMIDLDDARVGVGVFDPVGDAAFQATQAVRQMEQLAEGEPLPEEPAIGHFHFLMCEHLGRSEKECAQ